MSEDNNALENPEVSEGMAMKGLAAAGIMIAGYYLWQNVLKGSTGSKHPNQVGGVCQFYLP